MPSYCISEFPPTRQSHPHHHYQHAKLSLINNRSCRLSSHGLGHQHLQLLLRAGLYCRQDQGLQYYSGGLDNSSIVSCMLLNISYESGALVPRAKHKSIHCMLFRYVIPLQCLLTHRQLCRRTLGFIL